MVKVQHDGMTRFIFPKFGRTYVVNNKDALTFFLTAILGFIALLSFVFNNFSTKWKITGILIYLILILVVFYNFGVDKGDII